MPTSNFGASGTVFRQCPQKAFEQKRQQKTKARRVIVPQENRIGIRHSRGKKGVSSSSELYYVTVRLDTDPPQKVDPRKGFIGATTLAIFFGDTPPLDLVISLTERYSCTCRRIELTYISGVCQVWLVIDNVNHRRC
jgi:hypothetical protein